MWRPRIFLFVIQKSSETCFAAVLPNYFDLIPEKAIYVLQGQDGTVTCESKGNQIATLKWEKRMDDRSYVAVPNSWVTNIKDSSTNRVKAVLKIANAQLGDSGVYKCTVSVKPDKSDFKLTSIQVNGRFVLLLHDNTKYLMHKLLTSFRSFINGNCINNQNNVAWKSTVNVC